MRYRLCRGWLAVGATLLLAACAMVDEKAMSLVATSVEVYAVVEGRLMVGDMQLRTDRTGTLSMVLASPDENTGTGVDGQRVERFSCAGRLRYTSSQAGGIDMHCSDGTAVGLPVSLLTELRGYGYGQTAFGPVSLTFGLKARSARAFLIAPAGKTLQEIAKAPFLELL